MTPALRALRGLDRALTAIEVGVVTVALLAMVVLKFADVVLRNSGRGGVPEFATIAQHLVVWVGMVGASLAAAERKHIAIEVFAPLVTPHGRRVVEGIIDVATIFFCALCAYVASRWIGFEDGMKTTIFTVAGVNVRRWWSLSIIPVGFGLIALRFTKLAIERVFLDEAVDPAAEKVKEIAEADRRLSSGERAGAAGAAGAEAAP